MTQYYLSVIIPAYNDARRLPRTLKETIAFLKVQPYSSEIIVVTDGSSDDTKEVAESFIASFPSLRVIAFDYNKGKGFGVKVGMLAAQGRFRLFMDADLAVPIEFINQFLDTINSGFDIVIGSRALKESEIVANQPFIRHKLARLFGHLQRAILRLPFHDTQCGFKLFTAKASETFFPHLQFDCAYFDAELLYLAHRSGARIEQVGVVWRHDQETRLPIGMKRSLDLLSKLLKIRQIHRNPVLSSQTTGKIFTGAESR